MIAEMFNPNVELIIPMRMPANETNSEIETQPLTTEMTIRKCLK